MYSLVLNIAFFVIISVYLSLLLDKKWRFALLVFMFAIPLKHVYMTLGGHYLELWKVLSLLTLPFTMRVLSRYFFLMLPLRLLTSYFFLAFFVMILGPFYS